MSQRAAGSTRARSIERVAHPHAKVSTAADYVLDLLAEVAYAQDDLVDPLSREQCELPVNEGAARDRQE
jgi:hypothetical protein